ncbi:MAG: 5-formyltetrahydrofolate cyclo-ligase [Actinomycetota bacterium]|nr:5-formyltetrahydrofolate cyclo-ligase [Actinomycetota bacterium]
MTRRHDRDAGGDRDVLERKAELRQRMWAALREAGADRFPGAEGRIPNFTGAEHAAERLRGLDVWQGASTVKANPDSPQWPVRQRALEDGKIVFMAVPRLADERPFLRLDPDHLDDSPRQASSIKGSSGNGEPVDVDDLEPVDLVVTGCVAVGADGARLGKGGGFSDLEFAVAREAGLITDHTSVVTTVHEVQVVEAGTIPMTPHDVPVDVVVTPDRVLDCRPGTFPRPDGVRWEELTDDKVAAIPVLQRLGDRG